MENYEHLTTAELFELAKYTLDILVEHTRRYDAELDHRTSQYSSGVREMILDATRTDISVMVTQYRNILSAIKWSN